MQHAPEYSRPVLLNAYCEPMRLYEVIKSDWSEINVEDGPGFIFISVDRTKTIEARHVPVRQMLRALPGRNGKQRVDINRPVNRIKEKAVSQKTFDLSMDCGMFLLPSLRVVEKWTSIARKSS